MHKNIKNKIIITLIAIIPVITDFHILRLEAQTPPYAVTVTNIRFLGGIGKGPTSSGDNYLATAYLRGYGQGGTSIELTAEMNNGSGSAPMYGDVLFTITLTDVATPANTGTFNVTIPSGSHTGTAVVPYNSTFTGCSLFTVASGSTLEWSYTATAATGDYVSSLTSSTSNSIWWDNLDAPSSGTPALTVVEVTSTTSSITFYWTPISTGTDRDFYEYRVYYRASSTSTTGPYKLWNGSNDATLRGIANNPAISPTNDPARHFDASGRKYTTIPNLGLFTTYNYFITAVDVFGNEITEADAGPPVGSRSIATKPLTLTATISDGITSYSDFSTLAVPANRTLQETSIKVDIYTVTATQQPDACIIWFSPYALDAINMENGLNAPNKTGLPTDLDSVASVRTAPNKWTAYLPTIPTATGINQIIKSGTSVRFIVELKNSGVSTFVDSDSGSSPNDAEWTFYVGNSINFKPWPVRILNNVLTADNPVAYPAYYLTEDAYVTIRIYDIKGRAVATLIEDSFRRGGQNVKENGWSGSNKYKNKVGIGLYYVHISANSVSSGKTILNKFEKVVMAH